MQNLLGIIKWSIVVLSLLFWLLVSLANKGYKTIFKLIPGSIEWENFPVSSLIIVLIVLSYFVFFIIGFLENLERYLEIRGLKKRISDLENEIKELRNEPIKESLITEKALEEEERS